MTFLEQSMNSYLDLHDRVVLDLRLHAAALSETSLWFRLFMVRLAKGFEAALRGEGGPHLTERVADRLSVSLSSCRLLTERVTD